MQFKTMKSKHSSKNTTMYSTHLNLLTGRELWGRGEILVVRKRGTIEWAWNWGSAGGIA